MPMIESNEIPRNRYAAKKGMVERRQVKFLMSSSAEALATRLAELGRTVTVEAEYGDAVVEGSVLTLAHHGSRSANPCPCLADNGCAGEGIEAVGLSHLDLDSIGGCMAVMSCKPSAPGFWHLAAFVDTNGPHKLAKIRAGSDDVARLNAWWAWSDAHRVTVPRDGSVADVTKEVAEAMDAIKAILRDDAEMIEAGRAWAQELHELNMCSFVEFRCGVIVRASNAFVSSLYETPTGRVAEAVVAFNTKTGAITVSFANKPTGRTAVEIVQALWGPGAGGHAGIAESPRDRRMKLSDLSEAFEAVISALP